MPVVILLALFGHFCTFQRWGDACETISEFQQRRITTADQLDIQDPPIPSTDHY